MRSSRFLLLLTCLALAASATAEVTDMALDHNGTLYRLTTKGESLLLDIVNPEADPITLAVPGTTGDIISNPLVAYDAESGTVVMSWEESVDDGAFDQILVAAYQAETWFGPEILAGSPVESACHPSMLVQTATVVDEEEEEFTSTFVHLTWWSGANLDDGGYAIVTSIPLEEGELILDAIEMFPLRDLIPFGIACGLGDTVHSLDYPKLFLDPQKLNPQVLFVSIPDCRFGIMELELLPPNAKRRRTIAMWGRRTTISVRHQLVLDKANFAVGHNLTVVMYWDRDNAIDYAILGGEEQEWSEIKSLALSEELDHEAAVNLIRNLAH
jgi:hypothetical protein